MNLEEDPTLATVALRASTVDVHLVAPLEISLRRAKERIVVVLVGELDDATAPFLREKLVGLISELDADLVLDVGSLTFLDSTGLSLFVTLQKEVKAHGFHLVIKSPSPMARRLFQITGLTHILSIEPFEQPRYVR
jgi:anti-sigma B factor antagonist